METKKVKISRRVSRIWEVWRMDGKLSQLIFEKNASSSRLLGLGEREKCERNYAEISALFH